MSDVSNIKSPIGVGRVQRISGQGYENVARPQASVGESDTVEISTIAQMLAKIRDLPEIRQEKVVELRRAIFEGRYDVDSKLDKAAEALLEDIGEL